ncbi:unnamed protein product [Rhizoctonia solani]|uniref:Ricin B lectin domain-containing protein n=1 Tax=Rhizoctonia solani TaxID=456999 RepID=A0A8H3D5K6_9AGAM|nr:unnamed protein product [Rhizoctonia solani]
MGQIYQSQYPADKALEPGFYRISNAREGTAIQVSEHDPTQVITWKRDDGENQQWYLQRSGQGYQLQNRYYDAYLAVFNTDNRGQIYASRYPTTWVFLKYNGNYIIQLADKNRALDLHCGSGHNGNVLHLYNQDGSHMPHRIWKLERLGNDAGNKEPPEAGEETANINKELLQMQDELSSAKNELSELRSLLRQRDETIHRLQQDVKSKEEALNDANKANNEAAQLRNQHVLLESKLSHQQMEAAGLQAKVDRIEYLISQSTFKPDGSTNAESMS